MSSLLSAAPEAVEAECRVDQDCPPKLACIEAECVDPCLRRPCHPDQTCSVQNSLPLRTVICSCPDNTFVGPNGECKAKGIPPAVDILVKRIFPKVDWS